MKDINELLRQYKLLLEEQIKKSLIAINNCLDSIYKVVLVYDRGQYAIVPPTIGILYNNGFSDDDLESLWNPEEFELYATKELTLNDEPQTLVEAINEACRENRENEELVISVYVDTCIEMTKWLRSIQHDENSFFFATDPEMVETKKNVSVMQNKIKNIDNRMPDWF